MFCSLSRSSRSTIWETPARKSQLLSANSSDTKGYRLIIFLVVLQRFVHVLSKRTGPTVMHKVAIAP